MKETPLHVRVAEAFGATNIRPGHDEGQWWADWPDGNNPYYHNDDCCSNCDAFLIARYDTDWSATGPLIEKYKIDVGYEGSDTQTWTACVNYPESLSWEDGLGAGQNPLMAVCELILALKAAGKL